MPRNLNKYVEKIASDKYREKRIRKIVKESFRKNY